MKPHFLLLLLLVSGSAFHFQPDPWTPRQLMEPADLAIRINQLSGTPPFIVCVGPSALIKGSIDVGATHEQENLGKFRSLLSKENRQKEVIIYCGCCPFQHCPNIRPALHLLDSMGFHNTRLLNLSKNIKTDWIDHGYPVSDKQ